MGVFKPCQHMEKHEFIPLVERLLMPYVKLDYVEEDHEGIELLDHLCSREYCGRATPPRVGHTRPHLVCLSTCRGKMHIRGSGQPSSETFLRYWECWVCKRKARTTHPPGSLVIMFLGRAK